MIRVMIVDDHDIVREGIKMILGLSEEFEVIQEASDGREALDMLKQQKPDIILMDIRMPGMDGINATKKIKSMYPDIKIIILTTFKEDEYIFECLKNGADGYILKDVKPEEAIRGIKIVHSGNVLLQPEIATRVVKEFSSQKRNAEITDDYNTEKLTSREFEIAGLISRGKSNKEIGELLFISEGTVRNHITKILDKLELRDRTQIAIYIKNKNR